MASTNKTTHYNLNQYISPDKPTYLTDYNNDMSAIDTGMYNAQQKADSAYTLAGTADGKADTAITNAGTAQTDASTALTRIGTLTNLDTTEKTNLVGAINEVDGYIGNLTNLETTISSSLVGAINEVNTKAGIFSSTAQVIGKWINNKPVYRKVFSGTFTSSASRVIVELEDNVDYIISCTGLYSEQSTTPDIGFGTPQIGVTGQIDSYSNYAIRSNKLVIEFVSPSYPGNTGSYSIVAEYTKSTD